MSHKIFDSDSEVEEDERFIHDSSVEEIKQEKDIIEDSDSAPEDVDFAESKLNALQRVKDALKQIEGEKEKKRKKRRQTEESYIEQKKLKLKEFSNKKMPVELLECLPAQKPLSSTSIKYMQEEISSEELDFPEVYNGDHNSSNDEGNEDFIPLSSKIHMEAVCISNIKPLSSIVKAHAFRENRMYGGSVARESVRSKFAKMTKRKARFS